MNPFSKLFRIGTPFSYLALLIALVFTLTLPGCGGGGGVVTGQPSCRRL